MLIQNQYADIKLMYSLFRRCPAALEDFKAELKSFIFAEGQKLVRNEEIQNDELVRKLIEFKESMNELLVKSLDKDQNADLAIKNSFENFINENEKTAKSLVLYLDD